jgi:hypothetical protein
MEALTVQDAATEPPPHGPLPLPAQVPLVQQPAPVQLPVQAPVQVPVHMQAPVHMLGQVLGQVPGQVPGRSRKPVDLFVGPSGIPGANSGLFTRTRVAKGTCLGYYTGTVLASYPGPRSIGAYRNGDYFMELHRRPPWIPLDTWNRSKVGGAVLVDGTCLLSFANCCKGDVSIWNCDVLLTGAFVTNRAVQEGEEVIVNYGPHYWEK